MKFLFWRICHLAMADFSRFYRAQSSHLLVPSNLEQHRITLSGLPRSSGAKLLLDDYVRKELRTVVDNLANIPKSHMPIVAQRTRVFKPENQNMGRKSSHTHPMIGRVRSSTKPRNNWQGKVSESSPGIDIFCSLTYISEIKKSRTMYGY